MSVRFVSFQICFLLFAVLYIVSYFIITRYKRKSGKWEHRDENRFPRQVGAVPARPVAAGRPSAGRPVRGVLLKQQLPVRSSKDRHPPGRPRREAALPAEPSVVRASGPATCGPGSVWGRRRL